MSTIIVLYLAISGQPLDMSEGGKDSPSFSENATRTGYYLAKIRF